MHRTKYPDATHVALCGVGWNLFASRPPRSCASVRSSTAMSWKLPAAAATSRPLRATNKLQLVFPVHGGQQAVSLTGRPHVAWQQVFAPGQAHFLTSASSLHEMPAPPPGSLGEIAFAGRSNVGKSSLLNALTGSRIAKTSKTPGRTQLINFFQLGSQRCWLVDLPGYGYARAPHAVVDEWNILMGAYLRARSRCGQLRRVFLLLDSRHGWTAQDLKFSDFLNEHQIQFQVVLTKIDKLSEAELLSAVEDVCAHLRVNSRVHGELLCCVSTTQQLGITRLQQLAAREFCPE
eukprot:g798.t1